MRHVRLHRHRNTESRSIIPQGNDQHYGDHVPEPNIGVARVPSPPISSQPSTIGISTSTPPSCLDMDFELMWPDSEQLFQTIISPEYLDQWQLPLGNFVSPPVQLTDSSAPVTPPTSDIIGDKPSSIESIPSGGNHRAVHDVSRMVSGMSSNMTAIVEATSISSRFLDECLHLFFCRFIPTLPVLHRPTFVYRDCIPPLLLNCIAIGSLYLGPKESVSKGEALWNLAHTAITMSWQSLITHRGPYDRTQGVQLVTTALLGYMYGVLSKNRSIRTTSQAFHALGFFWARQCGLFAHIRPSQDWSMDRAPAAEHEHRWKSWAAEEVKSRTVLALYILDGLTAQISGELASERHVVNNLLIIDSEAAFEAESVEQWLSCSRSQTAAAPSFRSIYQSLLSPAINPQSSRVTLSAFSHRVVLEGLQSLLALSKEDDDTIFGTPSVHDICRALVRLHEYITQDESLSFEDRLETLLRWYTISLDTVVDSTSLCQAMCARYDTEQHIWHSGKDSSTSLDIAGWPFSPDGRRALLHAMSIQDIIERLPRGRAHTIHMSGSLMSCATVYGLFSLTGAVNVQFPRSIDWTKVLLVDDKDASSFNDPLSPFSSTHHSETSLYIDGGYQGAPGKLGTSRNLSYELNSIMKLFGCLSTQWGISSDMGHIVAQWITLCHRT